MTRLRLLAFASFAGPLQAVTVQLSAFLPAYYSQNLGLSLAEISIVFTLLRLFDIGSDLLFGIAIDKRPFRSGKYRPWILISIPLLVLACWLMYVPEKNVVSVGYIFSAGLILYVGYTLAGISHQSWCSEIAKGSNMTRIFGYREYAVIIGILASAITPVVAEVAFDADFEGKVNAIGYFLVVTLLVFGMICAFSVDDVVDIPAVGQAPTSSLKSMLMAIKDRDLQKLCLGKCLHFLIVSSSSVTAAFLVQFAFKTPGIFASAMATYMVVAFLFVPFWLSISRRWDEWITLRIAAIVGVLAYLMLFPALSVGGTRAVFLFFAVSGISFSAAPILLRAMIGKLADHYAQSRNVEMRGAMFGLGLFSEKIGSAIAVGGALALLSIVGFDPAGANDSEAIRALVTIFVAIPVVSFVGIFLITLGRRPDIDWRKSP